MITFPPPIGSVRLVEVYEEYEEPLLYTAQNERGETFLVVLAADSAEAQVWHFAYLSPRRLRDLRAGVVDLRDAFLLVEGGWITRLHREKVAGGAVWTEAIRAADLSDALLPDAGEVIEVEDENPVLPDVRMIAMAERRDVLTLRLIPKRRARKEVSVAPLARVLFGFQGCADAIGESNVAHARTKDGKKARAPRTPKGQQPPDPLAPTRFTAAGTFDASFGIELHAETTCDLFGGSAASDALEKLVALLEVVADEPALTERLVEFKGSATAGKLRGLLMGVSQDIAELHVDWAAPRAGRGGRVVVTQEQAGKGIATITRMRPDEPSEYWVEGVFDEAGFGPKSFQFIEDGPEGRTFHGRVDDAALKDIPGISIRDRRYTIRIRDSVETNFEGEVSRKFRLLEVIGAGDAGEAQPDGRDGAPEPVDKD